MNQTLNTLNELWIEAGEKVENYNDKINQMLKMKTSQLKL